MDDCIFCKIVRNEIPSYCIYEDSNVKAFLDVNPLSDGHTLIVPKEHYENIFDIDNQTLLAIENASKEVGKKLIENLKCDGVSRMQNNGYGQDVKHYHMHLVPRYINDGAHLCMDKKSTKDVTEIYSLLK